MSKPLVLALLVLGMPLFGCSSDDNAPQPVLIERPPTPPIPPPPPPPPLMPASDVAGTWFSNTVNNAVNCGLGEFVDAQAIVITQDENDIELLISSGNLIVGTASGDIISWTGDIAERGGTTTFTSVSLIASADTASGNTAWTWTDGTDSCNGTMAITASRNSAVVEAGPNSELGNGQLVNFVDGAAFFTGVINSATDGRDSFQVVLAADGTVQAELSHFDTTASDLDLEILDENFDQVVLSNSVDSFEFVGTQMQAGVTYYISVLAGATAGDETYNLSIDLN